ncbi:MAG: hypothetical protein M3Z35_02200, partial [Nitrospirota bacterium]|nr:hypothetical protein [Nitrospirota bacterium]
LIPHSGLFFTEFDVSADSPRPINHESLAAPFITIEMTPRSTADDWSAGLASPEMSVFSTYSASEERLRIVVTRRGEELVLAEIFCPSSASTGTAVSITENLVTVWAFQLPGWHAILSHRIQLESGIDLRQKAQLAGAHLFYSGIFDKIRAGYFGYTGLRDPQLVRLANGEPLVLANRSYFTATCAGPGFFQTAHWAVFSTSFDDPEDIRLESHLFFHRDGLLLGDHAGFLMMDKLGHFLLGVSSWGDFDNNVHIRSSMSEEELLKGVHTLSSMRWPVPTDSACWDPSIFWHAGRWWLSFVECLNYEPRFVFRPVLAKSRFGAVWNSIFDRVGADVVHLQTEGTLLTPLNGELYVLASDGDARDYPIYDLQMNRIATLNAPYGSNIPHPMIIERDDGNLIMTFDGTGHDEDLLGYGTHGDILLYKEG